MGKSIDPMLAGNAGSGTRRTLPALIGMDESPAAIPWQVVLPQSLPRLHRPGSECVKLVLSVEDFASNAAIASCSRLKMRTGPMASVR